MIQFNRYIIDRSALIIEDSRIAFDYPIDSTVEILDMVIVLLDIPPKIKYNENVFGVSLVQKEIDWQIEKKWYKQQPFTNINCSYNGLAIVDGKLRLNNWCDTYLIVDPLTGNILDQGVNR